MTCPDDCLDCNPGAAHLGEGMTIRPCEWTPIDDHGTQIYLYGDQSADIVIQIAPVDDEVRQLRAAFDEIDRLLDDYRGAKALREGAQAVVDRARRIIAAQRISDLHPSPKGTDMPYDDDARGHNIQHIETPEPPLNVVPVAADLAHAIREFTSTYPNLGRSAVFSEIRREFPDVTYDEIRTVMTGRD